MVWQHRELPVFLVYHGFWFLLHMPPPIWEALFCLLKLRDVAEQVGWE